MNFILVIITFLSLWLLVLTFLLVRVWFHYQKLVSNVKGEDLVRVWEEYLEKAKRGEFELRELKDRFGSFQLESKFHVRKVGLTRFNPFKELGGNQSFSVCFLDGGGDGVVISSLHGRETTRLYGKPVKQFGPAGFEFSQEEKDAIFNAQNTKS